MAALLAGALLVTGCGGSETPAAAPTPGPTGDRASLVAQFPADVQPQLEGLPDELVRQLLQVRQEGAKTLTWTDSGGEQHDGFRKAFLSDWEKITGWTVRGAVASVDSVLAQLQAQVGSGKPEWDVFSTLDDASAADLASKNMFEELDTSIIPLDQLPEGTRHDKTWVDWAPFGTVLLWNTKVWPQDGVHPEKVSDIFDTKRFPGKRCVFNFPQFSSNLEFAAMADGVPYDKVYEHLGTEAGVKQAFDKLSSIRKDLVFVSSGADSVQFVLDGECDLGITWNGRPLARMKANPDLPLAVTWQGALMTSGPLAIPRGAANAAAARTLIAFASQPQQQCDVLNELGYGLTLNAEPFPSCISDLAKEWGPQYDKIAGWTDNRFYLDHPELTDAWTLWQTKK
jgi:putative spermidine/putrescine transport system substrate-binding protein